MTYGWLAVANYDDAVTSYWVNGQENTALRMVIDTGSESWNDTRFGVVFDGLLDGHDFSVIREVGGQVTLNVDGVGTETLGAYRYVQLDIAADGVTLSGLTSLPSFGIAGTVVNAVTIDCDVHSFEEIGIYYLDHNVMKLRVDYAEIVGGGYPITKDYTLTPSTLWPNADLGIKITGVGVYGDSVTVGGETYTVADGSITVDGEKIRLKNAVFRVDGDTVTLDGHELSSTSSDITFDGVWSLYASAIRYEDVTEKELTWHAGEFGLDRTGIAAVGLLVCGGLLVGLGMTGARSGAKIGALLLICGGAALVYIMLI